MKRTIVSSLGIVAITVLMWWLPGWAEERANRLELEGTARPPMVPDRIVNGVREFDDIPPSSVELVPNPDGSHLPMILAPKDPVQKEQLRQAAIYRNVSNATKHRWWYPSLALTGLLVLSKTTNLLQRPAESEEAEIAVNEDDMEAAHKREMEKLDKLIELERLRQALPFDVTPPQPESSKP